MPLAEHPALLEREDHLELLRAAVAQAAAGTGGLVLVEGPAGVGKTSLLTEAADRAAADGLLVLSSSGIEGEADLGWEVVRRLLARQVGADQAWPGVAAVARPIFTDTPAAPGASLGAMLHGLFWVVSQLAEERPLLLVVDDVQWADVPSLRWLAYLAPRITDVPVVVALGARTGEATPNDALLQTLRTASTCQHVVVEPLSRAASDALVQAALPHADAAVQGACFDASRGLPFLLHGLLTELRGRTAIAAHDVLELEPAQISRWIQRRLAALSSAAQAVAPAIAVLGTSSSVARAATLSDLDERVAAEAADELRRAGLLDPAAQLRFAHPLVRRVCHRVLGPAERAAAHARAAAIIDATGGGAAEVAVHLLATAPAGRREVVATLVTAATEAMNVGDPDTTVALMQRALDEPPPSDLRAEVLRRLGLAQTALGDIGPGHAHLEQAVAAATDPVMRARTAIDLSQALRVTAEFARAVGPLERAGADLGVGDRALADRVEGELISVAIADTGAPEGAFARLARFGDPAVVAELRAPGLLAGLSAAAVNTSVGADAAAGLARRALSALDGADPDPSVMVLSLMTLAACDQVDEARTAWDRFIDVAARAGLEILCMFGCTFRAFVHLLAGSLADAEADASAATDAYAAWGGQALEPVSALILTQIERGRITAAQQRLDALGDVALPENWDAAILLHARARLHLAQGRAATAAADALEVGRRFGGYRKAGIEIAPAYVPWRSTAATALLADGRRDEAAELADAEVDLAGALGAGRALGVALRAAGLTRTGGEREALLHQSVAALAGTRCRVEHAHSLLALGTALRQSGGKAAAREPLRAALDLAATCGAAPLADRARNELRVAGARPRRTQLSGPDALTAGELRVVRLAAEGRTNREIAQQLFVTARTVETHLTHAYAKLGITSRAELAAALTPSHCSSAEQRS